MKCHLKVRVLGRMGIAALVLAAGLSMSARAAETITVGGTGSALGDMKTLAEAYMEAHPDVTVKVLPSLGSGGGIRALLAGKLDFSLSTNPLKEEQKAKGLKASVYARTPLVLATNASTPEEDISLEWLQQVYEGKVTEWPDGKPIRLVLRPLHDSDSEILADYSEDMRQAVETANNRPGLLIEDTAQGAGQKLQSLDHSLGSSTLSQVRSEKLDLRMLDIDGVEPTVENLASGKYPFAKTFYIVTRPGMKPAAAQFIEFIRSPQGTALLAGGGNLAVQD